MEDIEKEFKDIKKDIYKCYKQNKFTNKISWLSLPISLTIFIISRLIPPLAFLNIIPILLSFLNLLVMPTFKILKKVKRLDNSIQKEKNNLDLEKINEIYYEIKKFYNIGEIPTKYLWISFIAFIISLIGMILGDCMNLLIYVIPIVPITLTTSLVLSLKELKDAKIIIKDLGKIVSFLEIQERNKELEKELELNNKVKENKTYNYQDNLYYPKQEETTKVLKKGSRPF